MLELLSPAGSMESVTAAVQNGADAVYFGYGDFNARRNAKNFTLDEAAAAVSYCHLRGVKVYLTLNTLLTDRELVKAAELAAQASRMGADAVIVQDLGVVRMLRQAAPDLPVHGSTQMTIHTLDGVKACAELGMERVVLARELSRDALEHICLNSPIGVEVFAHGALCMCYSGQCFFSSVIGGRSGNRGVCAQPCRLKYGWSGKADENPLSLKDLSLAGHLRELRKMGVACLKIEGRMKRPEYVAIATRIYAQAIREGRDPSAGDLQQLEQAFSRQGFTDGYFQGCKGPEMFGTRPEAAPEPRELFAQARSTYESGEQRKETVGIFAMIRVGEPAQVGAMDTQGRLATVAGPVPEKAVNVPLTAEKVEAQLVRTGGTPYQCGRVIAKVEPGLSLPLSALNDLRRRALEELSAQRAAVPRRRAGQFHPGVRYANRREPPAFTVQVRTASQLSLELLKLRPELVYIPAWEAAAAPEAVERCQKQEVAVAALLPRVCWDREMPALEQDLEALRRMGVDQVLAGNLGLVRRAQELGFQVRGDFGLGVYNSQAVKELKRMGLVSVTASFEMQLAQIRDLSKALDTELIGYGRLPLMITENCIIHNHSGQHTCANVNLLTDRRGERFPVVKAYGCRNEILNSKKLFLGDKLDDLRRLGLWAVRLCFTTENPLECAQVLERYLDRGPYQPNDLTRGLYYRGVE